MRQPEAFGARTLTWRSARLAAECVRGIESCDELSLRQTARLLGLRPIG